MTAAAELVGTDVDPAAGRSDAQIIAASLHEPEDFSAVYGRHARTVHRYAYRRVGPEHAEDVVAETFVVAFRRRATVGVETEDYRQDLIFDPETHDLLGTATAYPDGMTDGEAITAWTLVDKVGQTP